MGDIRYFKIKDKEALLNWDKYNDRFKDWSEITELGNKYIKFYMVQSPVTSEKIKTKLQCILNAYTVFIFNTSTGYIC